MSDRLDESKIRASVDFAEASVLDTIVPAIPSVNIQDAFHDWDGTSSAQGASLLPFIEQRQFLLFDEHIPVYLVLRAPVTGEDILKSYLSRLAINLQAHAVDIAPQPPSKDPPSNPNTSTARSLAQPKDLLYSEDIAQSQHPFIAVRAVSDEEDAEEVDTQQVYVIWRKTIYLGRPKIRMQKPAIYFAATASLKHFEQKSSIDGADEYLESNVASPMNLLEPFNYDPAFAGKGLYLSASRVTKVSPAKPTTHEFSPPLRTSNRKMFQAAPAILLKVHYTRMPPGSKFPVLASLSLEVTAFASSDVRIEEIHTQLSNGTCETFGIDNLQLPVTQSPGNETTWVRRLASTNIPEGRDSANIHLFEIKVLGKVLLSDDCSAAIEVIWRSNVDLGPLPPAPGTRNSQSLSRGRGASISSATSAQALRRPSSVDGGGDQSPPSTNDFGITVTFSGPAEVHVGEILRWDVLLLNRSPHRRSLAIIALPKRKRVKSSHHFGQSEGGSIAHAILDEHTLYSLQARATLEPVGLVSLSPDVRIGPPKSRHQNVVLCRTTTSPPAKPQLQIYLRQSGQLSLVQDFRCHSVNCGRNLPPDTVAQSLTAIRQRAVRKPGGPDPKDDFIAIEIHDLDRKNSLPTHELIPSSRSLPPPFDFERLTRFMSYGFLMAPIQHRWFSFLSTTFAFTTKSRTVPALKRVAFDQLIFAPLGLAAFFTFMTVAEGGGRRAVMKKFQDVYMPALKANYLVWPLVQILNFRIVPLPLQIPFVSTVGIAWTAYLSLTNQSDEA
ncbi:MAG: hypothetical protein Q9157_001190 [Trypethelium eluteriae]